MIIRNRFYLLSSLLLALLWHAACWSQNDRPAAFAPTSPYQRAIDQAVALIQNFMVERNIPGLSAAAGVGGHIVWAEGFGYADLENRVPVTPLTKFRIGSVSKTLTSAALGLLYEQGKLDFDAPVQKYVPSFPQKRWEITVRQVAGHIAGIRHYRGDEFLLARRFASVEQSLEIFREDTLLFKPGERYSYSSYGWNLLSAVVEGASGQDFLPFMYENVFWPLGMLNTVADHTDSLISYRTRFYVKDQNNRLLNAPYVDNSYKWAGGGFLAPPRDLVIFGMACAKPGFLKKETIALLQTSMHTTDGKPTNYGIGWRIGTDEAGRRWVGHSGGSVGGTTFLIVYPESGVVVAIVANISSAGFGDLPQRLAALFMQ